MPRRTAQQAQRGQVARAGHDGGQRERRGAQARLQRRLVQAAPGRRAACRVRASRVRVTRCTGTPPAPPCPGGPRPLPRLWGQGVHCSGAAPAAAQRGCTCVVPMARPCLYGQAWPRARPGQPAALAGPAAAARPARPAGGLKLANLHTQSPNRLVYSAQGVLACRASKTPLRAQKLRHARPRGAEVQQQSAMGGAHARQQAIAQRGRGRGRRRRGVPDDASGARALAAWK